MVGTMRNRWQQLFGLVLLAIMGAMAQTAIGADIYKCQDGEDTIVLSDKPCGKDAEKLVVKPPQKSTQFYTCGSEKDGVTLSDKPCGDNSQRVQPREPAIAYPSDQYDELVKAYREDLRERLRLERELEREARIEARREAKAEVNSQPASRGLSLNRFSRIRNGMSEAEVLALAGDPDSVVIDADDGPIQKSYYYVKRGNNPIVSRIQFTRGRVFRTERVQGRGRYR